MKLYRLETFKFHNVSNPPVKLLEFVERRKTRRELLEFERQKTRRELLEQPTDIT